MSTKQRLANRVVAQRRNIRSQILQQDTQAKLERQRMQQMFNYITPERCQNLNCNYRTTYLKYVLSHSVYLCDSCEREIKSDPKSPYVVLPISH